MERNKRSIKIFAVSDIHGCASALKSALAEAGFDPGCEDHLLVVLGDLFDRGIENREVLAYLRGIKNKILIRGNHEDILMESLRSGAVGELQFVNDTHITLCEFFPYYHGERRLDIFESRARRTAEMLIEHITSMRDYLETENHIFVHGWITDDANESDFRYASRAKWHNARWLRWHRRYPHFDVPDGKTLVVGHTPAYYGSMFDRTRSDYDCSTFYGDHLIAIDGKCTSTGRVNVLVVEDIINDPVIHTLTVTPAEMSDLARGRTSAIVLPFEDAATKFAVGDKIRFLDTGSIGSLTFAINGLHLYANVFELSDEFGEDELGGVIGKDGTTRDYLLERYPHSCQLPLLAVRLS